MLNTLFSIILFVSSIYFFYKFHQLGEKDNSQTRYFLYAAIFFLLVSIVIYSWQEIDSLKLKDFEITKNSYIEEMETLKNDFDEKYKSFSSELQNTKDKIDDASRSVQQQMQFLNDSINSASTSISLIEKNLEIIEHNTQESNEFLEFSKMIMLVENDDRQTLDEIERKYNLTPFAKIKHLSLARVKYKLTNELIKFIKDNVNDS